MTHSKDSRRSFIKKTAIGAVGLAGTFSARSYARILGANDRVSIAVAGLNGRGQAHINAAKAAENIDIVALCDVDSKVLSTVADKTKEWTGKKPKTFTDVREVLEQKNIDALTIAAPDHWHTPMAIMAMKADKHVYVEKPCCQNPQEGEWLIAARDKYGKVVQVGNQQRSGPTSIEAIDDIRNGLIGEVYMGKCWYSNTRGSIGIGKKVDVPEWLNWELWQGPAPRKDYKDNLVHYNWHWFWHWGTGEINNNGFHEMDICRWALGVDYPTKVTSSGGRYHFKDDWEFYDTQVASFEFDGSKMLTWEGKSCNGFPYFDRGRGATIHGTNGTALLDRNGYLAYDHRGKLIKESKADEIADTLDVVGIGELDIFHMKNFAAGIVSGEKLRSPVEEAVKSNLLCHLGNISQKYGRTLDIDPSNGTIKNNKEAMSMWGREYEPGWEPEV